MTQEKIGLFGGTFDPPHRGHVAVVHAAWATGWFDRIVVVVAGDPYRKSGQRLVAPGVERLAQTRDIFAHESFVEVSDREIRRSGPSYSFDTVNELLEEGCAVSLIVGADVASSLASWWRASELAALCDVVVVPRDSTKVPALDGWRVRSIPMNLVNISSSLLRGDESPEQRDDLFFGRD